MADDVSWLQFEHRVRWMGVAQLVVYCSPQCVGGQCEVCRELEESWRQIHEVHIMRGLGGEGLRETTERAAQVGYAKAIRQGGGPD